MTPGLNRWLSGVLFLLSVAAPASAHTWRQVGVASNFLVLDERVYFIQADQSLTALDLATGRVLVRKVDRRFSGQLQMTEHGILVLDYGTRIVLLDKGTHAVRWETCLACAPSISGGYLVSYDGNGLVQCRRIEDGQIRWSYELPGALEIVAEKGKVLIHCAGIFPGTGESVVSLLDLETGQELLHKRPPAGTLYGLAYFDGDRIYIGAGASLPDPKLAHFEKLLVWDLAGKELSDAPVPEDMLGLSFFPGSVFCLNGKVFERGRIRSMTANEKTTGKVAQDIQGPDLYIETDGGTIKVGRRLGHSRQVMTTVEMASEVGSWRGYLPYLAMWPASVAEASLAEGKLLLGSNMGHVECIDVATGRSLWIYVFRTMRQTMSMTVPGGMPPYLVEQAEAYRLDNWRTSPAGLRLLPSGVSFDGIAATAPATRPAAEGPRVIYDPRPVDPFADLPVYLAKAWSGIVLPMTGFALLCLVARWRRWGYLGVGLSAWAMGFLLAAAMWFYGGVSGICTLTAKGSLIVLFAVVAYGVYRAARAREWKKILWITIALLLLAFDALPVILYS